MIDNYLKVNYRILNVYYNKDSLDTGVSSSKMKRNRALKD